MKEGDKMKGLKKVADATKNCCRVSLYYDLDKKTVYTQSGEGRYFVTWLINENTPADIQKVVERWLAM